MRIDKIRPCDIIAVIVVIYGFYLLSKGFDGTVSTILLAVTAFYFGLKSVEPNHVDENKE